MDPPLDNAEKGFTEELGNMPDSTKNFSVDSVNAPIGESTVTRTEFIDAIEHLNYADGNIRSIDNLSGTSGFVQVDGLGAANVRTFEATTGLAWSNESGSAGNPSVRIGDPQAAWQTLNDVETDLITLGKHVSFITGAWASPYLPTPELGVINSKVIINSSASDLIVSSSDLLSGETTFTVPARRSLSLHSDLNSKWVLEQTKPINPSFVPATNPWYFVMQNPGGTYGSSGDFEDGSDAFTGVVQTSTTKTLNDYASDYQSNELTDFLSVSGASTGIGAYHGGVMPYTYFSNKTLTDAIVSGTQSTLSTKEEVSAIHITYTISGDSSQGTGVFYKTKNSMYLPAAYHVSSETNPWSMSGSAVIPMTDSSMVFRLASFSTGAFLTGYVTAAIKITGFSTNHSA